MAHVLETDGLQDINLSQFLYSVLRRTPAAS